MADDLTKATGLANAAIVSALFNHLRRLNLLDDRQAAELVDEALTILEKQESLAADLKPAFGLARQIVEANLKSRPRKSP